MGPEGPQLRKPEPAEPVDSRADVDEAIEDAVDRAEAESRSAPPVDEDRGTDVASADDLVPASPPWATPWASALTDD